MLDLNSTAAANVRRVRWIALGSAELMSAVGEFHLATEIGIAPWLAWLLPVALGIYGYCAFAAGNRADVCAALALMVVCQGLAHLLAVELIPRHWALIITVSAVAPIVCWRVHHLGQHTPEPPAPIAAGPAKPADATPTPIPTIFAMPAPQAAEEAATVSNTPEAAPTAPARTRAAAPRKSGARRTPQEWLPIIEAARAEHPGMNQKELAATLGITDRWVRQCLKAGRPATT